MKIVLALAMLFSSASAFMAPAVPVTSRAAVTVATPQQVAGQQRGLTLQAVSTDVPVKATSAKKSLSDPITKEEVRAAVRAWCDGIVAIGKVFQSGGDYKKKAVEHIERHYAFDSIPAGSKLLFKPTLASEYNFRSDMDEFMSYFVGDGVYSEDGGFAIKPWSAVRFDTAGVFITPSGSSATTSGIYHFTPVAAPDTEVKVEYTFQFIRSQASPDLLKIVLHHSSVPFSK